MEQFNLEKWLKDKSRKIVTRDGKSVRIVCWDSPNKTFPIVGFIGDNPTVFVWDNYGYSHAGHVESKNDLFSVDDEEILSEDEGIRKDIVAAVETYGDFTQGRKEEIYAWLKKQGTPRVRTDIEWVNAIDDACNKRYSEEYSKGEYCHEQSFKWGFQEGVDWLEKQSEQKPTDKVEPKFKVGDFILNGDITNKGKYEIFKILKVCSDWYDVENIYDGRQTMITFVQEYTCRLWTIQDAKDGDVLSQDNIPFIFKSWSNNCIAYCGITGFGLFKVVEDDFSWCNGINVTPATKEQRELLFSKMREAGYEWDAEKKELKKIEQNTAWSEEDKIISNEIQCLIGNYRTGDDEHKLCSWIDNLKERVQPQPKQELSEKDEKVMKRIDSLLYSQCTIHGSEYEELHNWLKSIKPHWKPSEEQMMTLCALCVLHKESKVLESLYNDLKKL